MPCRLPLSGLVLAIALVPASPALAQSGGAAAPAGGGTIYEQAAPPPPAKPALRATLFSVSPATVQIGSHLTIAWRVDGPPRRVRARVDLVPTGGGPATHITLGIRRTGQRFLRTFTPRAGHVQPGSYVARLHASAGKVQLVRTAHASGRMALTVTAPPPPSPPPAPARPVGNGRFPVQGAYSFGGPEDRFGATRTGHVHQGQDVLAASGTPVVSPVPGFVYWNAYQAGGAGYYVVVRGDDGRDYVFMHFLAGSVLVAKGQRVAAGQRLASVGATGDAAGPHLHFEIWPSGWYSSKASRPIDPLPDLQAWAAAG